MSFTEDELQAFNTILEQRLSAQRREMEHALDQRMNALRRDLEQRLLLAQQEIIRALTHKLADQENGLQAVLSQRLAIEQTQIAQAVNHEAEQRQEQLEGFVDRTLAAQLMAIEELLNQRLSPEALDDAAMQVDEHHPHFEAIEVQTDLSWEDLVEIIGRALDTRFSSLNQATQTAIKDWEQHVSARIMNLRDEFLHRQPQPYNGNITNMQELFQSIEQLERFIESMQIAMTANHALLSNRLYHHQQLPLERAHPSAHTQPTPPNGASGSLSLSAERGASEMKANVPQTSGDAL